MQQARHFIQQNAANRELDHEAFQAAVDFDVMDDREWPIWVCTKAGTPVAWFNEIENCAFVGQ